MNTADVLRYGHLTLMHTIQDVPPALWEKSGACGEWSVKDILAHLTSFEQVLVDVLTGFVHTAPTPTLDRFIADVDAFNGVEVAQRQALSVAEIRAEYEDAHAEAARLLARIPVEMYGQNGALPWYGEAYDLDDFIVYTYYGHKREHCAQIAVFCDQFRSV